MPTAPTRIARLTALILRLGGAVLGLGAIAMFASKPEGVLASAAWMHNFCAPSVRAIVAAVVLLAVASIVDGSGNEVGPGYERVLTSVTLGDGAVVQAYVYALSADGSRGMAT